MQNKHIKGDGEPTHLVIVLLLSCIITIFTTSMIITDTNIAIEKTVRNISNRISQHMSLKESDDSKVEEYFNQCVNDAITDSKIIHTFFLSKQFQQRIAKSLVIERIVETSDDVS